MSAADPVPAVGPRQALQMVTAAPGPTSTPIEAITQSPTVGPIRKPPQVQAVVDRGSVRISGRVASRSAHRQIIDKVVATYGVDSVDDALVVDEAVGEEGVAGVAAVVAALGADASGVTVDLTGNHLTIDGYVPTEDVHDEVAAAAAQVTDDADLVDDAIRVMETATPSPEPDATATGEVTEPPVPEAEPVPGPTP